MAGAASLTVIAIVIIGIYKYYLTAIITVVRFNPFQIDSRVFLRAKSFTPLFCHLLVLGLQLY